MQTRNLVSKTRNFVLEMMNFAGAECTERCASVATDGPEDRPVPVDAVSNSGARRGGSAGAVSFGQALLYVHAGD